jgi:hypothetical protein
MFDNEVKIGDCFGIVLCVRVPTALRVGPLDLTGAGFFMRTAAVDKEGRRCLCL